MLRGQAARSERAFKLISFLDFSRLLLAYPLWQMPPESEEAAPTTLTRADSAA
ncbi:MAG: hypothetical protein ABI401_08915 [Candidatus Dormibacter sp.]